MAKDKTQTKAGPGRPTKYTKEYLDNLAESLRVWAKDRFEKLRTPEATMEGGEIRFKRNTILLLEFEFENRIPRGMLAHLVDENGPYKDVNENLVIEYGLAMTAQQCWLNLDPDVPASSRKLMLMHNHGMTEHKTIDIKGGTDNTNTNVNLNVDDIIDFEGLKGLLNEDAVQSSSKE